MPAPAALLVAAGITAVASNPIFIRFVYDPLIAPTLERLAENYIEQRRASSTRPAAPVDGLPQPGADEHDDIPLHGMGRTRRSRRFFTSTSYENGNGNGDGDEQLGLLMVQTARESDENVDDNMATYGRPVTAVDNTQSSLLFGVQSSTPGRGLDENVGADATLHRRSVVAVPVVDNTILEESSFLLAVHGSTTGQEPDESINVDSRTTLHRRPAAAVLDVDNTTPDESSSLLLGVQNSKTTRELNENIDSTATLRRRPDSVDNNNNYRFGSRRRTALLPAQDKKLRPEPAVAVSGLSLPIVPEWKTTVSPDPLRSNEERRRKDQVQWMSSVVDRRPLHVSSTIPTISAPSASVPPVPSPSRPMSFHVLDEPNTDASPQTSSYPTHLTTNSSVPPSLSRVSPLFSDNISTTAGVNLLETRVLDPWNSASGSPFAMRDGGLDTPASVSLSSVTHSTPSLQSDASGDSSSIFQFSVPRNAPTTPPHLPPLPTFSPLCVPSMSLSLSTHSAHSNQLTSSTSHQSSTLQLPLQSPNTPPHFTPPAQYLHRAPSPAPPNITTVPSSEIYQQRPFASPGAMSSNLSELEF